MVEVNWSHRIRPGTPCALSSSSFAPRSSSRRAASSLLNPDAALVQEPAVSPPPPTCARRLAPAPELTHPPIPFVGPVRGEAR